MVLTVLHIQGNSNPYACKCVAGLQYYILYLRGHQSSCVCVSSHGWFVLDLIATATRAVLCP